MEIAARVSSKGQVTVPKAVRDVSASPRATKSSSASRATEPSSPALPTSLPWPAPSRFPPWFATSPGTTSSARPSNSSNQARMSAFVDTNIIVRHLTGDPPETATRATNYLAAETELFLADLIVAETIYVLESFYKTPRNLIAVAMRSLVALRSVVTVDPALLLRALKVYESTASILPRRTCRLRREFRHQSSRLV